MTYLLDTNTCIRYLNRTNQVIFNRLNNISPDEIYLCEIVKFELYYGAYKSARQEANLATLKIFFQEFQSLPFEEKSAQICGKIRNQLNKKGTPIGVYDLQIAAIAMANNLILVTHNVGEFSRIDELKIEDWEIN